MSSDLAISYRVFRSKPSNPHHMQIWRFWKKTQENLEIRISNLESSKICVKGKQQWQIICFRVFFTLLVLFVLPWVVVSWPWVGIPNRESHGETVRVGRSVDLKRFFLWIGYRKNSSLVWNLARVGVLYLERSDYYLVSLRSWRDAWAGERRRSHHISRGRSSPREICERRSRREWTRLFTNLLSASPLAFTISFPEPTCLLVSTKTRSSGTHSGQMSAHA